MRLPVVAHVFLLREGQVLLARRANTGFEDGRYGPVGGHLEPGETILQAAIRECREEVGVLLDLEATEVIGVTHYTSPTGDGIDYFLRATRWVGEPEPRAECDALLWVSPHAPPQGTLPFVQRALEQHLVQGHWFDELGFDSGSS